MPTNPNLYKIYNSMLVRYELLPTTRFRGTGVSQGALFIKNPVLGTHEDRSCRH